MKLLEPLRIGSCTARNRVIFGPHETNLGHGRSLSARHLAYYQRRAAGGTGTIVIEEASVHPSDWPYERCPLARTSAEGWAAIAKAVHNEGALAIAAIGHSGGQGSSAYSQAPLWAPSMVPEVVSREVPKSMEPEDIVAVVDGFEEAARLAIEAGLDGVEVNAGQYSLIRQFLSDLTNHRSDEYGTDRLRFAREVLSAVRTVKGSRIVGLRLSCDELVSWGGVTPPEGAKIAESLADYIDYVAVVRGGLYSSWATRPDMHVEPGFNLQLAQSVRAVLPARLAVIAQGSLVDVGMAEQALSDGLSDGVEMTRAQIADPQLVTKAAAGQLDRIRPCILCNQACQVRDVRNPIVSCVGEPSSGHETEDASWHETEDACEKAGSKQQTTGNPQPAAGNRQTSSLHLGEGEGADLDDETAVPAVQVTVVGGGPAGLECARVAALRGYRVRLLERSSALGGSLRTAAKGAGRSRLANLADWLENECRALGVQIQTGQEVSHEELTSSSGTVVLCTGSRPGYRDYQVDDGSLVYAAGELLEALEADHAVVQSGPVAVWDPIGGPIAISVAELLASRRPVVLVSPDLMVGKELSRGGDLVPANTRLHNAGVRLVKRSLLRRVTNNAIEVEDRFSGCIERIAAAALVDCGPLLPDDALWRSVVGAGASAGLQPGGRSALLQQAGRPVARAGDAIAPRTVYEAILEGRRAALALGQSSQPRLVDRPGTQTRRVTQNGMCSSSGDA